MGTAREKNESKISGLTQAQVKVGDFHILCYQYGTSVP